MSEKLGILGVGHLASYVVAGLRRVGDDRPILLSPRNRERSIALQQGHACDIASNNQQVVDSCRIILLAVRPNHLDALLNSLTFTRDHLLISCAAGISRERVQRRVGDAEVVRTLPLACAEVGEGVLPLYPDQPVARQLLGPLGKLIAFDQESEFELASIAACVNGWSYALLDHLTDWFAGQGIARSQAREMVIHSVRGATGLAAAKADVALHEICDSIATPGTYTKAGLDLLESSNAFSPWQEACEHMNTSLKGEGN